MNLQPEEDTTNNNEQHTNNNPASSDCSLLCNNYTTIRLNVLFTWLRVSIACIFDGVTNCSCTFFVSFILFKRSSPRLLSDLSVVEEEPMSVSEIKVPKQKKKKKKKSTLR
eukprot:TRINITY_DN6594_c0_g2_i7.p2 TRINITY_DN6594_c0_g2~~TRINITY_DN6594_c0_g2_i7.p2  ORF type:complete len:111 (-),score=22.70 TRINITY_DN6594_c0_g2_i7:12-344(-)